MELCSKMIKYLIAVLFLSISVFLVIVAKQFLIDTDQLNDKELRQQWTLKDDPKNLFWFLQISDLHLSKFKDPSRVTDFKEFCTEAVEVVKPKVILASGDLTDAKGKIYGSQQYAEEWKAYYSTLIETGVLNKTSWLDIRGNHDNFNVQFLYSNTDLFRNFSAQGRHHKRSYLHKEESNGVKYNFMALDASVEPGTKRPYNFVGMVPEFELDRVRKLLTDNPANYTIWFAHYPTSSMMTPIGYDSIRKFIGNFPESSVYLAGHLHTLGGIVFKMYTLQPEGFLELELADFLKQRVYRVAVYDHGQFSFEDVKLGTWPIAVITNPKNVLFNNPFKEDIRLQSSSTHIRIVAFSTSEITQCKVRIDNEDWKTCEKKTENFFTVPWEPSRYSKGKHILELFMTDAEGRALVQEQAFALDGSREHFNPIARFVLMSDVTTIFQMLFIFAFMLCLLPMIYFKIWQLLIKYGKFTRPTIASHCWRNFNQRFLVMASIDRIYFAILFWLLYTLIGPWSFHEVLDGTVGYYFVWGTFVKGELVPGTLNWWYGFHQLMFFQLPLMIIISGVLQRRFKKFLNKNQDQPLTQNRDSLLHTILDNLPFIALLIAESLLAIFYLIQNGIFAFCIAPIRVWGIALTLYLFREAHYKVTDQNFKQCSLNCSPESKLATS